MKLKRDAKILKAKSLASLTRALSAFNSFEQTGRITAVLLHLQHSGEMLLKAALVQVGGCKVFGNDGKSIGMEKCLNHAPELLRSLPPECGAFRAVDAMRDTEQHWYAHFDEQVLFIEVRSFLTAFDDLLGRIFSEKLGDHLPQRVLPVSTHPIPRDIKFFFDSQFSQIKEYLKPARRQRHEARGRLRTLLAMEAHIADNILVTEHDVTRAEKELHAGKPWEDVFPILSTMATTVTGDGITVAVRISKVADSPPVRIVKEGDPDENEAAVVREYDAWDRYPFQYKQIAQILSLSSYVQVKPLAIELGIIDDPAMYRTKQFGSKVYYGYSHAALDKMKQAIAAGVDIRAVYRRHNTAGRRRG